MPLLLLPSLSPCYRACFRGSCHWYDLQRGQDLGWGTAGVQACPQRKQVTLGMGGHLLGLGDGDVGYLTLRDECEHLLGLWHFKGC